MFKISALEHTADLAFRIEAVSREELVLGSIAALSEEIGIPFSQGNPECSLFSEAGNQIHEIKSTDTSEIDCLIELLNDWLFLVQVTKVFPAAYQVDWEEDTISLKIHVKSEEIPLMEYESEIKSITYHQSYLKNTGSQNLPWRAEWIADI